MARTPRCILILAAFLLGIAATTTATAVPVEFALGDLLSGSTETLALPAPDCGPLPCPRTTGVRIRLSKPDGPVVGFPDTCLTPSPVAPIPIPYPNTGGRLVVTTGEFTTPTGDTAVVSVGAIVDAPTYVEFELFVQSLSGYQLSSLVFQGRDTEGMPIERELALLPVPEPGTALLLGLGLAAAASRGARRRQHETIDFDRC